MTLLLALALLCGWDYESFADDAEADQAHVRAQAPGKFPVAPPATAYPAMAPSTSPAAPRTGTGKAAYYPGRLCDCGCPDTHVCPCATKAPAQATPPPAKVVAPPVVAPPVVYRATDATGQAWHHADPAVLNGWIAHRNATVAPPAPPAAPAYGYGYGTVLYRGAGCASGRCGR